MEVTPPSSFVSLVINPPQNPFNNFLSFPSTLRFVDTTSNFKASSRSSTGGTYLNADLLAHLSSFSAPSRIVAVSTTDAVSPAQYSGFGGPHRHWIVVMEPPKVAPNSKPEIVDYYVRTLEKVLGSERDAQMCMYDTCCDTHFGFCCDMDEEIAYQLTGVAGVLSVKPDLDFSSLEKDYSFSKVLSSTLPGTSVAGSLLFPMGSTKHWLVRVDNRSISVITKSDAVDHFVQILTRVLGNHKDAQMCIYHVAWKPNLEFCCELDEECARQLAGMPGVLAVAHDANFESADKDCAVDPPANIDAKKLFVTGLSFYTSEKTLRAAFEVFGELLEVKVIMDKISKRSKGYAFVEYSSKEAARAALEGMNGKIINGWMIMVDYAKNTNKSGSRRRRPNIGT